MSDLLNQASLVMVPSGYKEDIVYSVVPSDGSGDLSFTRASNGTRVNSAGLVEVCPWNLLEQSESFSTSPWANTNVTLTSGQTDPNGGTTAFRAQFSGVSYLLQNLTALNGTNSVYAKAYGSTAKIRLCDPNGSFSTQYNLTTEWQRITTSGNALAGFSIDSYIDGGWTSQDIVMAFAQTNIGSTAKPYFPTTDRLNVPRLTYQNGGGGCPSLLLEKQSTNYAIYSQDLTQSATSLSGGTVGANVTTSPDGTQNADSFTVNTATSSHAGYYETYNATNGQPFTTSIFLKAGTGRYFLFRAMTDTYSTRFGATIDLQSGTILSTNTSGSATGTASKIENFGNGWYRVSLTINAIGSQMSYVWGASNTATPSLDANLDYSYTGNGTDSYYLWGMTLENSSYPTSYIPTTSSSATRVADECYKTNISSLIGQTEGVIFWDGVINGYSQYNELLPISLFASGATTNGAQMYIRFLSTGAINFLLYNGSSVVFNMVSSGIYTLGSRVKVAGAYKNNDFVFYVNGTQIGTSTSGSVVALADLYFDYQPSSNYLGQHTTNEAILFKTRLTNAELASLTTI